MKIMGIICRLLAVVTLLAGALDAFRAIDPTLLAKHAKQLYQLPALYPALIIGAVTVILSIITRILASSGGSRRFGTGGAISTAVIGCAIAGIAVALTTIFPNGIIGNPANETKAPISSDSQVAQKDIDSYVGACTAPGWRQAPLPDMPGVSFAIVCASTQTAYVVFTNQAAATIYKPIVESQAQNLMQEYVPEATNLKISDYRILDGPQWIAVSRTDSVAKLQKAWGGQVTQIP